MRHRARNSTPGITTERRIQQLTGNDLIYPATMVFCFMKRLFPRAGFCFTAGEAGFQLDGRARQRPGQII